MTNPPTDRRLGAVLMSAVGLLILGGLIALCLWYLWWPQHVLWARNAYGMASVGAWTGWEGFLASAAFWFFELRGRTVVTVLGVALWMAFAWLLVNRLWITRNQQR